MTRIDGAGSSSDPPRDDVVLFGDESGGGGGWRSRRWWLAALLAVAVAIGISVYAERGGRKSVAPTPTPIHVTPPPIDSARPTPSDTAPTVRAVGQPILGITASWELFASGTDGIVRIEFAAGRVVRTPMPPLQSTGPAWLVVGGTWALVRPLDRVPGYLIRDGQPAGELTSLLDQGGVALPGPGNTVWLSPGAMLTSMSLIGLDGRRVGPSITLPRDLDSLYTDGSGNVIASGSSGGYLVRPHITRKITSGSVIAVGPTRWLVRDCNDLTRCPPVVVDRATGTRRAIRDSPVLVNGYGPVGTISPDGTVAAVVGNGPELVDPALRVRLVSLATGADRPLDVPLGDTLYQQMLAWSPDSRWLFVVGRDGLLYAVDVASGHATDFGILVPPVQLIAVRSGVG
jgi:hypothetical protein